MHLNYFRGAHFVVTIPKKFRMKKEEIHLWDIKRILIGQAPPEFLLEVFIRSLVIYLVTILVLRWMGKRMNGQLTIVEISVMIMMGAIISVPMQLPDRGILQGVLVLFITLACLRGINWLAVKNVNVENLVQGQGIILVKDGVLQRKELTKIKVTNQQVFEILRSKNVFQLGKVERMYMEACGIYSIYQNNDPRPGLPLFPPVDETIFDGLQNVPTGEKACNNCGLVHPNVASECTNCGNREWTKAII